MTGVRHLVLAVVAAVLALGLGLALGAGPVVGRSDARSASRESTLSTRSAELAARVDVLEQSARTDAKVITALAGPLTDGRLAGRSVLIVRTPGASADLVRRTRASLLSAGAGITGELRITRTYLDPAKATAPLEDLALRLVPPGVTFADGASSIERVAAVLGRSTLSAEPPGETDQDAAEVIAGLTELGAVRLDGDPGRLAQLAVVLGGPTAGEPAKPALVALVRALDSAGSGAVLAGAGRTSTLVGWARDGAAGGASTVDGAQAQAGQVALVLALAEQGTGQRGDYGTGAGATSVLPVPAPADGSAAPGD